MRALAHADEFWVLRRPLYGLPEADAIWNSAFARHHRFELDMRRTENGPVVFVRRGHQRQPRALVSYRWMIVSSWAPLIF